MTLQRGFCLAVLLLGTLGATGIAAADETTSDTAIHIEQEYERLDERGTVAVTLTYELGSDISRIRTRLEANITVASVEGMQVERENGHRWLVWDGDTRPASATLHVPVNQTSDRFDGYTTYDARNWTLAQTLDLYTHYWWSGDEQPTIERTRTVAGEGVVGSDLVYLGPYTEYNRTLEGETVRVVDPAAVTVDDPQGRIDALSYAIKRLDVGTARTTTESSQRRDNVTVFVVPSPLRVGNTFGSDFLVNQNASLSTWFHEYTHTRQRYHNTEATEWTREAIAEYYGTILAWEYAENIDSSRVEYMLDSGRHDRSILSRPTTWNRTSDYRKGATTVAMLDARIRNETGGNATFQDVFGRMNTREQPLENGTVREASTAVAGSELDGYFSRYIYGRQSPPTSGYYVSRGAQSTLSITATARNDTVGEINVTITNAGPDTAAAPELTVDAPGAQLVAANRENVTVQSTTLSDLSPGESTTVVAKLYPPPGDHVAETVSVSMHSLGGNQANTTVAVEYGAPEQTPTPATDDSTASDADTPTTPTTRADGGTVGPTTERTPGGTGSDPNDDLLAGFGILVGASIAVLGVVVGIANAAVSVVWQSFVSKRTIYLTIAAGLLLTAVSSVAVIM
ncbi:hypothetical protein BRC91_06520 [Halobacteriales archaeon QS_4_62_28]|nr:MAG: hypothetical protein BRC91_06520 [Halobacteriales archaeon QS_4_62_28]